MLTYAGTRRATPHSAHMRVKVDRENGDADEPDGPIVDQQERQHRY
jgi:hypothetical protein